MNNPRNPRKLFWLHQNNYEIEIFPIETNILLEEEADYKEAFYISKSIKEGKELLNYSDNGIFRIYRHSTSIQKYPGGYVINVNATKEDYIKVGKFLHHRDKLYRLLDDTNKRKSFPEEFKRIWTEIVTIEKEIGESENYQIKI